MISRNSIYIFSHLYKHGQVGSSVAFTTFYVVMCLFTVLV